MTRKKSVRMSLPPTFSTTPPAIEYSPAERKKRHEPWSHSAPAPVVAARGGGGGGVKSGSGWHSRIPDETAADLWADSSEEDEEYGRARTLLTGFSKKK